MYAAAIFWNINTSYQVELVKRMTCLQEKCNEDDR